MVRTSGGRKVLVIDDNADGREALRTFLELGGHRVEVAENGHDGIARALATRPEVALIDIGLPDLDGYTVARRLREGPAGRSALLVALTGYGRPDDRRRALDAGFDAHLVKPVDPQELTDVLAGTPRG
jgi:two-component system, sensor histidine kinase